MEEQPREERLLEAKRKALHILERMDRTEAQLHGKLADAGFEEDIIEEAVNYVKSYGYIDDERYVRSYITYRSDQKSRRQLMQELQFKKGVSSELIEQVCEELGPADERHLIRCFLEKKQYHSTDTDEVQRRRMVAALTRRGFSTGDILAVMKEDF
ncbi:MAG: recombination regulator RecX [Lachnospiraceae bacterium]|nr:recombination regulator RecX [Lachnospiraceae bacterium]